MFNERKDSEGKHSDKQESVLSQKSHKTAVKTSIARQQSKYRPSLCALSRLKIDLIVETKSGWELFDNHGNLNSIDIFRLLV
jgi:hypothetical protein